MAKTAKKVAKFALPIAGSFTPLGPILGAAAGGGIAGLVGGGGVKGALTGALTGGAGAAIGGALAPSVTSGLGNIGSQTIAKMLGVGASNALGSALGKITVGNVLSNVAGNSIADSLIGGMTGNDQVETYAPKISESPSPEKFTPKQESALSLPNSLTSLSGVDPTQLTTNLATQGVYGGGLGPEESKYFMNLINRRLVDETGNVDKDLSEINPVELSYLSQMGITGRNPTSILEALSRYGAIT